MIQRPGNCPECGAFNPFTKSYFTPEKEVIKPERFEEHYPEFAELLREYGNLTIEHADGDWWYHTTKSGSIERWPLEILKVGIARTERVGKTWREKR